MPTLYTWPMRVAEQRDTKMTNIEVYIEDAGTITIDGVTFTVSYEGEATFDVQRDVVDHRHDDYYGGTDIYGDVFHYEDFNPAYVWAGTADDEIVDGHIHHDAAVAVFAKWIEEGGAGVLEQQATEKDW